MITIQQEYFLKGVDNQKRPDVSFKLRRIDIQKFKALDDQAKADVVKFLESCQRDIQFTIDIIKSDQ